MEGLGAPASSWHSKSGRDARAPGSLRQEQRRQGLAEDEVGGGCDFDVVRGSVDDMHFVSGTFEYGGVVGHLGVVCLGVLVSGGEPIETSALGRLHGYEHRTIQSF